MAHAKAVLYVVWFLTRVQSKVAKNEVQVEITLDRECSFSDLSEKTQCGNTIKDGCSV
jgi:hypothetical protein